MDYQKWPNNVNELRKLVDWSSTPLGAMENWPKSLYSALQICLASDTPTSIFWGKDPFLFYNSMWDQLLGDGNPKSLGKPAREVLNTHWETLKPYIEEVFKNGKPKEVNALPLVLNNNEKESFNISFNPLLNKSGQAKGVSSIVRPSKEFSNEQLQRSEPEFYDFFEHAPIALHWLGPDGTILQVNQAELDMLGYTREEYVGHNISEFFIDKEFVADVLQRLQEAKSVHNCEAQMLHKDGSIVEISLSSNAYTENGKFVHTRCFTRNITDQKNWERRLEASEQRYRTLVDNFPKGAVGLFDEDLRYTAAGGAFMNQVGIAPEDRIGYKITDIYPEEMIHKFKPFFEDVFKGESNSFEVEYHNRHLFGQTLPITNDQGEIISGMLVVQDITQRWQAQQELRESEAKFRMMAENLKEAIWMLSEDGEEFIYINPAFEKIWGIDRNKLYEESWYFLNFVHPDDRDEVRERYDGLPENEFDNEYRIIRPDGEMRWLHARGSKVYDGKAGINRIIGITEDITQRKQAEQQLRMSKNRIRTALDIETVGVIFWGGDDLTITEANDAFLKMSGFSREEMLGKSWRELTPEEFYSVSNQAVKNVKTTGHTPPYEKQYIRKDGSRWWGLFAPRRIDENEAVEFVLDITDRKETQQKLEAMNETLEQRVEERTQKLRSYQEQLRSLALQLNKAEELERQRLAAELHDTLGQELAVAKMRIEGMKYRELSQGALSDLEELKGVVDHTLNYTHNLMMELKPPPALNKEDATEVLYWIAKKMEAQGLEIEIEDDEKLKPVEKDMQTVLHQSVRELLRNVIKHAETKKAKMQLTREEGQIKVTIQDNGKGFDKKDNQSLTTEGGHFGLFNIKERMDWHGGRFELYSEPGKGTRAVLYAPLKESSLPQKDLETDQKTNLPPAQEQKQTKQHNIKILLVDDHEMMRRGLREMVEKQDDIEIIGEASHGQEAIELAREMKPDIILMDVNMPVMDGIEATKMIKAEMPDIRIIGLSLHESQKVIDNMQNAGASAYLTKNEAFESLVTTIRAESPHSNGSKVQ